MWSNLSWWITISTIPPYSLSFIQIIIKYRGNQTNNFSPFQLFVLIRDYKSLACPMLWELFGSQEICEVVVVANSN